MFNTQIKDAGAPAPKNKKKPSFGKAKGVLAPKRKKPSVKPGGMGIGLPSLPGAPMPPQQPMM